MNLLQSAPNQSVRKVGISLILLALLSWGPMELYLWHSDGAIDARRNHYLGILKEVGEELQLASLRDIKSGKWHGPGSPSEYDIAVERTRPKVASVVQSFEALSKEKEPIRDFAIDALYLTRPLAKFYGCLGVVLILATMIIRPAIEHGKEDTSLSRP